MASWAEAPVVVPLDGRKGSVRAVPVAGRIARRLGNELRVVSVVAKFEDRESRTQWLSDVVSEHLGDDEFTMAVAVASEPSSEIAEIAEPGDLVCMATAGSVRFHNGHWGSVAEEVARALRRPMLMVGPNVDPDPGQPTQRVIAPMDGSHHAEAAADPAAELAAVLEVPLWLVEVVSPGAQAAEAAHHSGVVAGLEERYVAELQERLARIVDIEIHHTVIQSENPHRAISEFVGNDGTAVMSTRGRSGPTRVFAGSVTAGVVAHSRRAVVVIRPDHD
jgi:nucleotide-binding universal stress UspA family protein